jgi:serine protease Do
MSDSIRTAVVAAVVAVVATMATLGIHGKMTTQRPVEAAQGSSSDSTVHASTTSNNIVETVKDVTPAVASVIIAKDVPTYEQQFTNPFGDDPFFDQFFGGRGLMQVPQMKQNGTEHREIGGGTAFFISADGLLMTNKHVVSDDKADYTVFLNDGRKLKADVATIDPGNDIALLKVDAKNAKYLTFANEEPMLGQQVIAIGNSLGEFKNTVSVGVISGLSRTITAGDQFGGGTEELRSIIQTDAAINQGNSGGPLLDANGNVIGMNTAIAQGAQNIGFAIPAQELKRALASYQKNGRIVRPYLGVRYVPITKELKEKNHLAYDEGVLIIRGDDATDLAVIPGSPADKAGLEENDIILEIDGVKLTDDTSLATIIRGKSAGDTVKLKISHHGEEKTVTVTLEEQR